MKILPRILTRLFLLMNLTFFSCPSQPGTQPPESRVIKIDWSIRLGSIALDRVRGMALDAIGSIILTGVVDGASDLNGDGDMLDGTQETDNNHGIVVLKFSSSKELLWSRKIVCLSGMGQGLGAAADVDNNIIVTGYIYGNVDLNGDMDTNDSGETDIGDGNHDFVIIKYDTNGSYVWSKRINGRPGIFGFDVETDSNNNVFCAYLTANNTDFNGDGDFTDSGETISASSGLAMIKWNSSGNLLWAKRISNVGPDTNMGSGMALDSNDNIVVVGCALDGGTDFNCDGDILDDMFFEDINSDGADAFVAKFSKDGNLFGVRRYSGSPGFYSDALAIDNNNNIIIGINGVGNLDLNNNGVVPDIDAEDSVSYGLNDILIVKLNTSLDFLWAKRLGGSESDAIRRVTVFDGNKLSILGRTHGNVDFNDDGDYIDQGETLENTAREAIVASYDSNGEYIRSFRFAGIQNCFVDAMASNKSDRFYISFSATGDVDTNADGDTTDGGAESSSGLGNEDVIFISFSYE